jgi:outer membrane lipoprotein-sorting protein
MRPPLLLGLLMLLLRVSPAQSQSTVAEILKKVGETYTRATEYELVFDDVGGTPSASSHHLFAFRASGQYRFEGAPSASSSVGLMIYDGSALWMYFPRENTYARFSSEELSNGALDPGFPGTPASMEEFVPSVPTLMRQFSWS